MGRSNDLLIGETAIAIGNPVGLQHTVTTGVISALHRDVEFSNEVVYRDLIQTDASINPGNSGGPLLNIYGELIGVNTAIRGDAQNIGFAIPVDQLREVLPAMLDIEKRQRVAVGMTVTGEDLVRVSGVRDQSPAYAAGVRSGDQLLSVDAVPVTHPVDFHIALLGHRAGDRVPLVVRRGGETRDLALNLREIPPPDGAKLAYNLYGMTLEQVDQRTAQRLGLERSRGVLVTAVDRGSPADRADIHPGDLVVQLGPLQVSDLEGVGLALESVQRTDSTYIRVWRFRRRGRPDAYEGYIHAR
jgi:serine protease Do